MDKKRVKFPKGKQKEFIMDSKKTSGLEWIEFSKKLGLAFGTVKSYTYEACSLPYNIFKNICEITNLSKSETLVKYKGKKEIWEYSNLPNGSLNLGHVKTTLSETNITFKNTNLALDNSKVKFSKRDLEKEITLPKKITPLLAEEVGVHLGDGFISGIGRRYSYRVKGHDIEERDYYASVLKPMLTKLFNVKVKLKKYQRCYGFEEHSQAVWTFKVNSLGIQPSPKTNIGIPERLKVNNEEILRALVRGYFDTDGCIYFRSQRGNKHYYPVMTIASISKTLIDDYVEILNMLGFKPYVHKNKLRPNESQQWTITLNGYERFRKYKEIIGWNNPKHLKRIKTWEKRYPDLV